MESYSRAKAEYTMRALDFARGCAKGELPSGYDELLHAFQEARAQYRKATEVEIERLQERVKFLTREFDFI